MHRMRAMMAAWLLIWLGSQPPDLATVSWLPETDADFAESGAVDMDAEAEEDPCPLTLFVSGLHAGGDRELLLFGEVSAAPGSYRSFLLRSEDEAASWTEVMPPVPGSSVHELSFTSPSQGRALVGWVVEGHGTLWTYATGDGGRTWRQIGEVPKPHNLDMPLGLTCVDAERCLIPLECYDEAKGPAHVLETRDGGRSWRLQKHPASSASPRQDLSTTVAPDGTSWQVVEPEDWETLQILSLPADESSWSLVASLPRHYFRAPEGTLVPCERR